LKVSLSGEIQVLSGASIPISLYLRDKEGFEILFPPAGIVGITVGSSRPSVARVDLRGGNLIVTGGDPGECAIVFTHIEKLLVGLVRVCVEESVFPTAISPIILAPGSRLALISASADPGFVRLPTHESMESLISIRQNCIEEFSLRALTIRLKGMDIAVGLDCIGTDFAQQLVPVNPASTQSWRTDGDGLEIHSQSSSGKIEYLAKKTRTLKTVNISVGPRTRAVNIIPIGGIVMDKNSQKTLRHRQFETQKIFFLPIGVGGEVYSVSPLISHAFSHACVLDPESSEIFSVSSEVDGHLIVCSISPVVGTSVYRIPKRATVTVRLTDLGFEDKVTLPIEPWFHVVSIGSFSLPVPLVVESVGDVIDLGIAHLASGTTFGDCQAIIRSRSRHVEISPIGRSDGKFSVSRHSPLVDGAKVTVICKNQEVDIQVKFAVATSTRAGPGSVDGFGDEESFRNFAWWIVSLITKIFASIFAILGVAILFSKTHPKAAESIRKSIAVRTSLVREKTRSGRMTMVPSDFVAAPVPDRDTFFGRFSGAGVGASELTHRNRPSNIE
jgi:hypothetical protein